MAVIHLGTLRTFTDKAVDDNGKDVQHPRTPTVDPIHYIGTCMMLKGVVYYYGNIGGLDVARNLTVTSSAPEANHTNESVAADAGVNSVVIKMTDGGTGVVANEYDEGVVLINNDAGQGQSGRIKSHDVAASAQTASFTIYSDFALQTAITTASEVSVSRHPYRSVIITPTTLTAPIVGVTPVAMPTLYWGWFATWGRFPCLVDTSNDIVIGNYVSSPAGSATDSGAVGVPTGYIVPSIGTVTVDIDNTEYALIKLTIEPFVPTGI